MKAAWYERQGTARDVLIVGEMPEPMPAAGEVRIRIAASGINPGDIKKRQNAFGYGMSYPRVIPHSDGAGIVDKTGEGVSEKWLGQRVWCYGAQSYRPFGTAAEFVTLPLHLIAPLPAGVSFETGASLGIPGITAHRAIHVAGPIEGRRVLINGRGAVGSFAMELAQRAGAIIVDDRADLIVEVAFGKNIHNDLARLAPYGAIVAYASDTPEPSIPFWPLLFNNTRVYFIGSDDFPLEAKLAAVHDIDAALEAGWHGPQIAERLPLDEIARAHALVEQPLKRGRVTIVLDTNRAP